MVPAPIEENQHGKGGRYPTSHDEAIGNCTPSRTALDLDLAEDGQPENNQTGHETSDEVLDEVEQISPPATSSGALPESRRRYCHPGGYPVGILSLGR